MSKVQAAPPAKTVAKPAAPATKPVEKPAAPAAEKAPEVPTVKYVTSAQLAEEIGIKSTTLRRWLRTLPQFQDGGYTRYKWEEDDQFLADAKARYEKFAATEKEKQEKRLTEAREKAEKKAAGGEAKPAKVKKTKAEPEAETEDEEVFDEESSDEGEELE